MLYLPLWALEGDTFESIDEYKHTCTVTGAVWQPDGRAWTGDDDLIDCGRNTIFDFGTNVDFSLAAWINCTDASGERLILSKGSGGAGGKRYDFMLEGTSGKIRLVLDDNANQKIMLGVIGLADSAWHFVAVAADRSGNGQLYVDGATDGAAVDISALVSTDDTSKDLTVGVSSSNETSNNFEGTIGEVWVYRGRVLPVTEIDNMYKSTAWRY